MLVPIRIGNRNANALLDTGAQCCVLKKSFVPIGTPIVKGDMSIKGVNGPQISVIGSAKIPIEFKNTLFIQDCIVTEDTSIDFPATCAIILGANFVANNKVDISTTRWALVYNKDILQPMNPSWIDGRYFSHSERDYIENSGEIDDSGHEIEQGSGEHSPPSGSVACDDQDRDFSPIHHSPNIHARKKKLFSG